MVDEQLRVATDSGLQVLGRVSGNETGDKILIFSHGFGVKSDSRGMFNKICAAVQDRFLTIRFHYVSIDDLTQDTYVTSYSSQIEKLMTVVERMNLRFPNKKIIFISHSQGCWISSAYIAKGPIMPVKHIMLAPSPTVNVAARMRMKLESREGAILNEQGPSVFPRTDGTKTIISPMFWKDAEKFNPLKLLRSATKKVPTVIIWGTKDALRTTEHYKEVRKLRVMRWYDLLNGHEFAEDNADGLVAVIQQELNS